MVTIGLTKRITILTQAPPDRFFRLLLEAADTLKLPYYYHDLSENLELRFGPNRYVLHKSYMPFNDRGSFVIAGNKKTMNQLLNRYGFPVPQSFTLSRETYDEHSDVLDNLPYPIVAKPTKDTSGGYHVICNIQNKTELQTYLAYAFLEHPLITIETFIKNLNQYRVLVFFGKVIGVVKREPARITGDGVHSITQLVTLKNRTRENEMAHQPGGNLLQDQEYSIRLKELNLTPESIPKMGQSIQLCYNVNASRGGTTIGMGNRICPENADLFCRAAKVLNLNFVGFDVICCDIEESIFQTEGYIIEANSAPAFTIHEMPFSGEAHPVTKIVLKRFIRMHPFYYLKHRLALATPPIARNFRLWLVLLGISVLAYLFH
jgi:D-alanine-D-alanine ligase-like ATP-grasp enzyme